MWKKNIGGAPNTDTKEGALASVRSNGIMWGGAADNERAYFGLSGGSVTAIALATGDRAWSIALAPEGSARLLYGGGDGHTGSRLCRRQRRQPQRPFFDQ